MELPVKYKRNHKDKFLQSKNRVKGDLARQTDVRNEAEDAKRNRMLGGTYILTGDWRNEAGKESRLEPVGPLVHTREGRLDINVKIIPVSIVGLRHCRC